MRLLITTLFCSLLLAGPIHATVDAFAGVEEAMQSAKNLNAHILAPRTFEDAMDDYDDAKRLKQRNRSESSIRSELDAALASFKKSMETAEIAKVTLRDTIQQRERALSADAPATVKAKWDTAQEAFQDAATTLERGNLERAKSKGKEATDLYSDAELAAIKATFLDGTKRLLKDLEGRQANEYAPITFGKAKNLIERAESLLNKDRYETAEPIRLAREAQREAMRADSLTNILSKIDTTGMTTEQYLLEVESLFKVIGDATDSSQISYEKGFNTATQQLVEEIRLYRAGMKSQVESLQDRVRTLTEQRQADRSEAERLIAEMGGEIRDLQKQLGMKEETLRNVERQALELAGTVTTMKEIQERLVRVEGMFEEDEANVVRTEKEVRIEMHGFNFEVGKANIQPGDFGLLTKVQQAVDLFPGSEIIVEGHTDSLGREKTNMELSEERANAVVQYLTANMGLTEERLKARGHGESKPVASNETKAGRALNRRIDITIRPAPLAQDTM